MSKKSEREARERKEQQASESRQRFSLALTAYLQAFATYYRQPEPTEQSIELYALGLSHLTPNELKAAVEESLRKCKFFPTVAEMLECLKEWQDRQPQAGTASQLQDYKEPTKEEKEKLDALWKDTWDRIGRIGKYKSMPPAVTAKKKVSAAMREPGED